MPSNTSLCSPISNRAWDVFKVFLRLGLTSFGGPVAHLAYFRSEFVTRRQWLNDQAYADIVALCQFLPGPASSQVGMAIGLMRGGYAGALAAWAAFTLPSAIVLILLASGLASQGSTVPTGMLHGLKIVAVAVVAQAVWGMWRTLCPDIKRTAIMLASCGFVLFFTSAWAQIAAILAGAVIGRLVLTPSPANAGDAIPLHITRRVGLYWLSAFAVLLAGLPLLAAVLPSQAVSLFDAFYRTGAMVFGGGHVVLPLLQAEVVTPGWVDSDTFLAGYGATQAVPGPLFTFSAFLGASMNESPSGWAGGLLALVAIFLPSFLLVAGALPFWNSLRLNVGVRAALAGINAAVVGLLLAALYHPVWTSAVHQPLDVAFVLLAGLALTIAKLPPWAVVAAAAVLGWLIG